MHLMHTSRLHAERVSCTHSRILPCIDELHTACKHLHTYMQHMHAGLLAIPTSSI